MYNRMLTMLSSAAFVAMLTLSLPVSAGATNAGSQTKSAPEDAAAVSMQLFRGAVKAADQLSELSDGQSRATEFFKGPDGLIGIVGYNEKQDREFIAWASPDGEALIIGPVIHDGKNLTAYYQKKVLGTQGNPITQRGEATLRGEAEPASAAPSGNPTAPFIAAQTYQQIQQAEGVTFGNADKHLYMFYDTFCPYCARGERLLKEPIENGEVMVTYIPVAAMGRKSLKAAAVILDSDDRQKTFAVAGGILANQEATPKAKQAVIQNSRLLGSLTKRVATPTFVLVDKHSGNPYYIQGLPTSMDELVGAIKPRK